MDFSSEQRYEIDGRRVSRAEWLRSFREGADEAQAAVFEEIKAEVEALRCPTHGASPKVSISRAGSETRLTFESCCEDMERRAEKVAEGE